MKNVLIVGILILAGWFMFTKFAPSEKEKSYKAGKQYGDNLAGSIDKAENAKAIANLTVIRGAINTFHMKEGRYPYALDELVAKGQLNSVDSEVYSYDSSSGEISVK